MSNFIIDCHTKGINEGIKALKRLKDTISVENGGVYWANRDFSQIHLCSTKTEEEIDHWLWKKKWRNFHYIGVIEEYEDSESLVGDAHLILRTSKSEELINKIKEFTETLEMTTDEILPTAEDREA